MIENRASRIFRIKTAIQAGTYETPAKIDAVAEAMLPDDEWIDWSKDPLCVFGPGGQFQHGYTPTLSPPTNPALRNSAARAGSEGGRVSPEGKP